MKCVDNCEWHEYESVSDCIDNLERLEENEAD